MLRAFIREKVDGAVESVRNSTRDVATCNKAQVEVSRRLLTPEGPLGSRGICWLDLSSIDTQHEKL